MVTRSVEENLSKWFSIPGSELEILLPDGWEIVSVVGAALVATEPRGVGFATNLTVLIDPSVAIPSEASIASLLGALVAPILIDAAIADGSRLEVLVCHLVGDQSVTAHQLQVASSGALVILTVSAATERWAECGSVAADILLSVRGAS